MMQSWTAPLWCVLVTLSLTQGQDDQPNDSLRTAIEALSRRQRDLAASGPNYYVGGGLAQYRYSDADTVPRDELAFLATPRDFTGDGQPENIGYGYQKTIANSPRVFPPQAPLQSEQAHPVINKGLKKFLLGYVDDEMKGGPEDGDDDEEDEAYYRHGGRFAQKSSPFRERAGEERHAAEGLEAMRKRDYELRDFVPTTFRERVHDRLFDDAEEKKVKILTDALARKMEDEEEDEEERRDRQRGRMNDESSEEEYLDILRSVLNKYRKNNPDMIDIEDISEGDIGEILNYLESNRLDDEDVEGIKEEARKRQYDGGYDFLTHDVAMGGWGVGGHQFRKRWNQRLDGDENQKGSFLYSLKFVSPAANREAIESLKDDDGLDLPDERDEDILRISSGLNRKEPDPWFPAFERSEGPEELFGNPNEEDYQRLVLAKQGDHRAGLSRKRFASLGQPNYSIREMSPIPHIFPTPGKKYLYDTAILKKRYPVTKRSSNFYTSPPLLHHKSFAFVDNSETRKNKDAVVTTDPKVERELNQIFSSPTVSDHLHSETHPKETAHGKESSEKTTVDTEHVATTHAPVASNSTAFAKVKEKENSTSRHDPQHRSGSEEKPVEQPVTTSRSGTSLDIKKKSINWSDYFGIDRRRKKTGPKGSGNEARTSNDHPIDDEWLFNQYYKAYATSTNPGTKRSSVQAHEHTQSKKAPLWQPFDTRVFDTDIFSRTAEREASKKSSQLENAEQSEKTRIDNMDTKLRNVEDEIVNEALKYTGAHEGTTDAKEIQEVKDKVMANLATAYNLEKMRQALREFRSSLLAQKMSRYNPENSQLVSSGDEKKKRVAVKKEKAEQKKDEDKKKRGDGRTQESNEDVGEFLQGPVVAQPLSESDMDRHVIYSEDVKECPILEGILNTCQSAENLVGDHGQLFLPLCSLHQICYLCGLELGAPSPAACDIMFMTEADLMCLGDTDCQHVAQKSIALLRRSQRREEEGQCWKSPCIAHHFLHTPLPAPIPASSSR